MSRLSSPARVRRIARLTVECLEDRCTPATATYAAGSQTLILTPANSEDLNVEAVADDPTGYLTVKVGTNTVFDSGAGARPVRNMVVRLNAVDDARLLFNDNVRLGGNLTVFGARTHCEVHHAGVVGGNMSFVGRTGNDNVWLRGSTIGGNIRIAVGESTSSQQVWVGASPSPVTVGGSLTVTGGSGQEYVFLDRLYLGNGLTVRTGGGDDYFGIDDVNVAGRTLIDLGAGNDQLKIETVGSDSEGSLPGATTFGATFTVRAGAGDDTINLSGDGNAATLIRFGSRIVCLGGSGMDGLATSSNEFKVTGNFEDFETGNSLP